MADRVIVPDLIAEMNATAAGKPIGRPAEVNIRNNHMQYIITWLVPLARLPPEIEREKRLTG